MSLAIPLLTVLTLLAVGYLLWLAGLMGKELASVGLAISALQGQVAESLGLAREAQQERERERATADRLEIGSFVPSDEDAARLERAHRVNEGRFLSARASGLRHPAAAVRLP